MSTSTDFNSKNPAVFRKASNGGVENPTEIKYKYFGAPGFVDGFTIISSVYIPPGYDAVFNLHAGGFWCTTNQVFNLNGQSPILAAALKVFAQSGPYPGDGKAFSFNDIGSVGRTINFSLGFGNSLASYFHDLNIVIDPFTALPNAPINQLTITVYTVEESFWTGSAPPAAPSAPTVNTTLDTTENKYDITFGWTSNSASTEKGFIVYRAKGSPGVPPLDAAYSPVGYTPVNVTSFVDSGTGTSPGGSIPNLIPNLVIGNTYFYKVKAVKGDGVPANSGSSAFTAPVEITFNVPNLAIIGSGGIDFGGAASMQFILDPSGIYTVVKNKTHDTLYERMTGITSNDVKIPDPFFKTGYIP